MFKFITLLICFGCCQLTALPVGNVADSNLLKEGLFVAGHKSDLCDSCVGWCESWSVRTGFYGDYVFDRKLEIDRAADHSDIQKTKMYTNAGYLALNFWDRFDLFGTLGASHVSFESVLQQFVPAAAVTSLVEVATVTDFSWSVGGRASLCECGCFTLGMAGQYFHTKPRLDFSKRDDFNPVHFNDQKLKWQEWQVSLGLSYRVTVACWNSAIVPYMAGTYSSVYIDMNDATNIVQPGSSNTAIFYDLKSQSHFGYGVGITFVDNSVISFTIEGRFVEEKGLYLNGQIRF